METRLKLCYQMFDLLFNIFCFVSENRESGVRFLLSCSRMQKIEADKVNIMECDPKSTSVTSKFFPKSNSVHYDALTMEI